VPLNNMIGGAQWSDDHCAELTRLLASGMVYRLIAVALNEKFETAYSKNAVVGKVQRLNLTPPDKPKRPPYVRKPSERRREFNSVRIVRANSNSNAMRVVSSVVLEQAKLRCVEIECTTTFDDVTGCRYPVGDGPFLFCNGAQMEGSSYCLNHHVLCHDKPRVPIYRFVGRAA
jgi:GcrA cell cycle regulator